MHKIPALRWQRQKDHVSLKPVLSIEQVPGSQGNIPRPCLTPHLKTNKPTTIKLNLILFFGNFISKYTLDAVIKYHDQKHSEERVYLAFGSRKTHAHHGRKGRKLVMRVRAGIGSCEVWICESQEEAENKLEVG